MNPVQWQRLEEDYAAARAACQTSRHRIQMDEALGDPPTAYHFRFRCTGVARLQAEEPVFAEEHRLYVRFPPLYPAQPPVLRVLTPVVHPHIWANGVVCLGAWRPSEGLDILLQRVGDLLTYAPAALNWRSVANDDAARWARRHQDMFPLDVPLFAAVPSRMLTWTHGGE